METHRTRLDIYPSEPLRMALDEWRIRQPGGPTRAEAARRLIEEALVIKGVMIQPKDSDKVKS